MVERTRFIAVMLSGALSGVGGICFAYSISANFSPNIYMGYGYLAIAAMIFGNWNIPFTALVCLFFGLAKSGGYQLCLNMGLPSNYSDLFMMLPYILTLFAAGLLLQEEPSSCCGRRGLRQGQAVNSGALAKPARLPYYHSRRFTMKTLIRNAKAIVTCDAQDHVYWNADLLIDGPRILKNWLSAARPL